MEGKLSEYNLTMAAAYVKLAKDVLKAGKIQQAIDYAKEASAYLEEFFYGVEFEDENL